VLARDQPVARLRAGDVVAFSMAGAYGWNISHHDFLMHPRPGFHFL
jgi:diaminopimelate decarboxylase